MAHKTSLIAAGVAVVAIVAGGGYYLSTMKGGSGGSATDFAYEAMPVGITIQPIGAQQGYGAQRLSFRPRKEIAYSNEKGLTLYTYDKDEPGKSNCTADCVKNWIPVTPLAGAKPIADWTIVNREDGGKQWAHKGKPLYTFVKDKEGGEVMGVGDGGGPAKGRGAAAAGAAAAAAVGLRGNEGGALSAKLPAGWHTALFMTGGVATTGIQTPLGFGINEVADANAITLVDSHEMTLYAYSGDVNDDKVPCAANAARCPPAFTPVAAPLIAQATGDWSFVMRKDGFRQWTYKGHPLYTYDADTISGDVNGIGADKRWRLAAIESYYMPSNITFQEDIGRGRIMATADGRTLYRRDLNAFNPASIQVAHDRPYRPRVGRMIRHVACDAQCLKTWHPYLAPADAQPIGYWGIEPLADGTKQWTYKDFALYTYDGDKKPGDMTGDSIYDVFVSDDPKTDNDRGFPALYEAGFFWTFVTL